LGLTEALTRHLLTSTPCCPHLLAHLTGDFAATTGAVDTPRSNHFRRLVLGKRAAPFEEMEDHIGELKKIAALTPGRNCSIS